MKYLVALDIGTTNVRTIVYTDQAHAVFTSSENVIILEPETGAAEINEDQLWSAICAVTEAAVNWAKQNKVTLLTMGVSCQRNTGKSISIFAWLRVTYLYLFRYVLGTQIGQTIT